MSERAILGRTFRVWDAVDARVVSETRHIDGSHYVRVRWFEKGSGVKEETAALCELGDEVGTTPPFGFAQGATQCPASA